MNEKDGGQAPEPVRVGDTPEPNAAAAPGRRFRFAAADRIIAPVAIFFAIYLSAFLLLSNLAGAIGFWYPQWVGLISVALATVAISRIWEHGRWAIGIAAPPGVASREFVYGIGFALGLIVACDLLVVGLTDLRHTRGNGFPWYELIAIFLPAAVHEEFLFRGYIFQKLLRWGWLPAYAFSAIVFAALHVSNAGISPLALLNLAIAGILLGLAYERYERLWFPIGIHLAWNLLSGPVLGHEVSGYVATHTLMRTTGEGPVLLTGGEFGIEGSIFMTVCEVVGVVLLWRAKPTANSEFRMKNEE